MKLLLTTKEVAAACGVSPAVVLRLGKRKVIRRAKENPTRYTAASVSAWLRNAAPIGRREQATFDAADSCKEVSL
jgi:hypothetical protein